MKTNQSRAKSLSLLKRFSRSVVIWQLPVIITSGFFGYFAIKFIAGNEIKEFLTYEMERIQKYTRVHNDLPQYHMVAEILPGKVSDVPFFRDTLLLETGDLEMALYRELLFPLVFEDGEYTIVLRHLMLDQKSVIKATLVITLGLSLLIFLTVLVIVPLVAGKIWRPFYTSLDLIKGFHPDKAIPDLPESNITEFSQMNDSVGKLLARVKKDYQKEREFSDNTSHEMQTQLAIIKATTENMLSADEKSLPGEWVVQLNKIHYSASRLSQIQKSLLLLARISNEEFTNNQWIDLKKHIEDTFDFFGEMIQMRNISLQLQLEEKKVLMDLGLTNILINNLVKNAVKHNLENGFIAVVLDREKLRISNPGLKPLQNPELLKRRFEKGPNGNRGIGLAMVDQICTIYGFTFHYHLEEEQMHVFEIFFQ